MTDSKRLEADRHHSVVPVVAGEVAEPVDGGLAAPGLPQEEGEPRVGLAFGPILVEPGAQRRGEPVGVGAPLDLDRPVVAGVPLSRARHVVFVHDQEDDGPRLLLRPREVERREDLLVDGVVVAGVQDRPELPLTGRAEHVEHDVVEILEALPEGGEPSRHGDPVGPVERRAAHGPPTRCVRSAVVTIAHVPASVRSPASTSIHSFISTPQGV
jgi:hypothetical protein